MKQVLAISDHLQYNYLDDKNVLRLIHTLREGVDYNFFSRIVRKSPFSMQEWCIYLNMSLRSLQRYHKEKKIFNRLQSEKIIEIGIIYNRGTQVFGDKQKFNLWLDSKNISLGGVKPKDLLDSSFGSNLLLDELGRIEYGILA